MRRARRADDQHGRALSAGRRRRAASSSSSRAACRRCARMRRRCCEATRSERARRVAARVRAVRGIRRSSSGRRARASLTLAAGPGAILLHGHCHQKSMGLLAPAQALLVAHPGRHGRRSRRRLLRHGRIVRLRARALRRLARDRRAAAAAGGARARRPARCSSPRGVSCRHQVADFTGDAGAAPGGLLRSLLDGSLHESRRHLASPRSSSPIIVSCVTQLNVGVLAIALAWIVGVYVGGMPVNDGDGAASRVSCS